MNKLLIFILLQVTAFPLYSQSISVKQLTSQLPKAQGTAKVKILNALSLHLEHSRIDQAARYNQEALALAAQLHYKPGLAEAYRCLGEILLILHDNTYVNSYLQEALKIFRELNDKRGIATTLTNLGTFNNQRYRIDAAEKSLLQSRQLFKELNDQKGVGEATHQLAEAYFNINDYPTSLKYYQEALEICKEIEDNLGIAATYNRIGDLYSLTNQRRIAFTQYQAAFGITQSENANLLSSNIAAKIGGIYLQQQHYSFALKYFLHSLNAQEIFFGRNQNPWRYQKQVELYQQFGELYNAQGAYNQSLAYFQKALQIVKEKKPYRKVPIFASYGIGRYGGKHTYIHVENLNGEAYLLNQIGQVYLATRAYPQALEVTQQSLELAKKQAILQIQQDASLTLSKIYVALKDYSSAYQYHVQYAGYKDLLTNEKWNIKRAELTNYLTLNQKQSHIDSLWSTNQRQRSENYAWIGVVILSSLLVIILIRNNRRDQLNSRQLAEQAKQLEEQRIRELEQTFIQKQAETEMAALRAQMNPHFIFNCLNAIKFYSTENESAKAAEYLTKFSKLIRLVLENSRSNRVSLKDELAALQLYMEMEAMRFGEKLSFHLETDSRIDTDFVEIPPLLIQPYVENAIWHGLMHKEQGGTVWVRVEQPHKDRLTITIRDDGVGRAKAMELKSKSATQRKSFGMKITSERIELINQLYQTHTQVEIQDLTNAEGQPRGTQVVLQIPI